MIDPHPSTMIINTYHHIYNRGAHKAPIFSDGNDYWRMLKLLYIANSKEPFVISRLPQDIFSVEKKDILVDIVAYCLMPNHIHIAIRDRPREESSAGSNISRFMHKLSTGYSTYYNIKYDHSGTIWQGPYKEKAVYDESYIRTLINYIHLNPYGLENPKLKDKNSDEYKNEAVNISANYEFSSMKDYLNIPRTQAVILCPDEVSKLRSM